jgi:hypothetical protein
MKLKWEAVEIRKLDKKRGKIKTVPMAKRDADINQDDALGLSR